MSKLDSEEKGILEAFEAGKLKPVKNRTRELVRHRKAAEETFEKGQTSVQPTNEPVPQAR
jgi:hypothetical protein